MAEFLQNYGIWIAIIGAMFLMHRLGLGCGGGHRHGQDHGHGSQRPAELQTRIRRVSGQEPAEADGERDEEGPCASQPPA